MRFIFLFTILLLFFSSYSQTVKESQPDYSPIYPKDSTETLDLGNGMSKVVTYYSTGDVKSVAFYKDNKPHGNWKEFWPNGVLYAEAYLEKGKKKGEWRFYNNSGDLVSITEYQDNRMISAYLIDPNTSKVISWK